MQMANNVLPIDAAKQALTSAQTKWGGEVHAQRLKPVGPSLVSYLAMLAEHDAIPTAMRDGIPWFVAYVDPCKELMVAKAAPEQGLFAYCPKVAIEVRVGPRRIVKGQATWKTRTSERPYIRSYVFVQDDGRGDCQFRIKGIKHVQRLVSFAGYVAIAPDVQIQRVRRLEVNGFIPEVAANVEGIGPGDFVRIVDGPFEGFYATVLALERHDRITIELQVFGSLPRVEIALHQVELVSRKVETPPRR